MKNPMDRQLEKRLSDRAVEIGSEGQVAAFAELLTLLQSSSANARRLSASALGKLAWMGVDQVAAVAALALVARGDPHDQTRQYAIKALKVYGAAAQGSLHDLRDMAANPAEKDYIRSAAAAAVAFIEEAVRIAAAAAEQRCQRCNSLVSADEFARSDQAFQRVFCQEGKCLISVYPRDLPVLDSLLTAKLRLFGFSLDSSAREAKPESHGDAPLAKDPL